jgi:hypothetical protein
MLRSVKIDKFDAYVHATPKDGHCLLHAIAQATYLPYLTGIREGKPISKREIVRKIRRELLERVQKEYKMIAGGALANSSLWNDASKKENLEEVLKGSGQLGEEVKIVIEHFFEKNVLVVNSETLQLFSKYDYRPSRPSLVVYHTYLDDEKKIGHFEMVSVRERKSGIHATVFPDNHPFIRYLLEK